MPRFARPRLRPRRLEGIERLNTEVEVSVSPVLWGDEAKRREQCRRYAELWLELRDEVLADLLSMSEPPAVGPWVPHLPAHHWSYQVIELGAAASFDAEPCGWLYGSGEKNRRRGLRLARR